MSKTTLFKAGLILAFGLSASAFAQTESFCSTTTHSPSAQKKEVSRNEVGKVGNIGYELWDENGNGGGKAIFYDDGSMDCYITNAKDYLCRAGLSLGSTQTYDQLNGDMVAEFKLIKTPGNNVQYSYIGVYGWMENVPGAPNGLVEYYVIDNTLSQYMPSDWIGDTKLGDITVDGAQYTVYRNTRNGPAITIGNGQFYQYFSVRKSMRDCGTINISEHMRQWEKKGLKMGKLYEAKVLGEAGNTSQSVSGSHMDFPHARVYVGEYVPPEPPKKIDRKPFGGTAAAIPGTVEAENFDEGNYGDSYSGTQGASGEDGDHDYRGEDYPTVDIVNGGTGKAIGYTAKDLWLEYTVNVTEDGEYDIEANVSNGSGSGKLELSLDGKSLASLSFTGVEGDWDTYEKSTGKATLTKGEHVLRITVANDNTNIDYVKFSKEGTTAIAQQVRMNGVAGTVQVFDISGKLLGKVEMVPGVSLSEAIATKFQKSGVYMVKTAAGIQKVRVTSR
ncbi:glycoside hydrolase family 11 protein [Fibrobacter sp. UWR2]|uniref:glycoside hydrolase family 11 protein n=1 Tax=Fibrobacter sp. UWR2 TaxID=1964352 RepID=UPI000B526DFF|nr:hypothetical protein B7994_12385 [Fibrobacter sp. UWR2]